MNIAYWQDGAWCYDGHEFPEYRSTDYDVLRVPDSALPEEIDMLVWDRLAYIKSTTLEEA